MSSSAKKITPEIEFATKDNYRWFVYGEKDVGLRLVCLEDLKTGAIVTTPLANPKKRVAAHKAWAGARHSRAPGEPWEIMHEMGQRGVDPDKKLETTFKNYGHASVGDMASIQTDIVNVPIHFAYSLFNLSSINSGQEKSTRYQKAFGKSVLHGLGNYLPKGFSKENIEKLGVEYQSFGKQSLDLFAKYRERIIAEFVKYYKPKGERQFKSLEARALDCVRFFLLLGQSTGLSFETSARDWTRIIAALKASPIVFYQKIATQIERLLTPSGHEERKLGYKAEAPSLIEFTQALTITNDNLSSLKKYVVKNTNLLKSVPIRNRFRGVGKQKVELASSNYSASEKMVVQYILSIWPGLERKGLLKWVKSQPPKCKKKISKIIFRGNSHHKELPDLAATSEITLVLDGFYGETLRDLNRHRAWGRFGSLPLVYGLAITKDTMMQILAKGFGLPLYLIEVKQFDKLKKSFADDMRSYYKTLYAFMNKVSKTHKELKDFSFMINLLPQAHRCELWMHGNPKQAMYMTHIRSRHGGHINYRTLAYDANQLIANSDPCLEGLRLTKKPNPKSKLEFFDRG